MLKGQIPRLMLGVLPHGVRRSLGINLGAPHMLWSLRQLKQFGFSPATVLDVGAFNGDWTLACLAFFPRAEITCIEPQDYVQERLTRIAEKYRNVRVIQTLLGCTTNPAVPFEDQGSGSSVLVSEHPNAPVKQMTTIDQLIYEKLCEPPEMIKLDTQGYEIQILEGWTNSFEHCKVIQCEISLLPIVEGAPLLHELVAYLEKRGFVMFDVTELIRSPSDATVWQLDALFCRIGSSLRRDRKWST